MGIAGSMGGRSQLWHILSKIQRDAVSSEQTRSDDEYHKKEKTKNRFWGHTVRLLSIPRFEARMEGWGR